MHRTGGRDRLHQWVAADPSAYSSSQACCDGTTKVPDLMENSVPARPVYVQRGKTHIGTGDEDRWEAPDFPRQRPAHFPLTRGNVGGSPTPGKPGGETPLAG